MMEAQDEAPPPPPASSRELINSQDEQSSIPPADPAAVARERAAQLLQMAEPDAQDEESPPPLAFPRELIKLQDEQSSIPPATDPIVMARERAAQLLQMAEQDAQPKQPDAPMSPFSPVVEKIDSHEALPPPPPVPPIPGTPDDPAVTALRERAAELLRMASNETPQQAVNATLSLPLAFPTPQSAPQATSPAVPEPSTEEEEEEDDPLANASMSMADVDLSVVPGARSAALKALAAADRGHRKVRSSLVRVEKTNEGKITKRGSKIVKKFSSTDYNVDTKKTHVSDAPPPDAFMTAESYLWGSSPSGGNDNHPGQSKDFWKDVTEEDINSAGQQSYAGSQLVRLFGSCFGTRIRRITTLFLLAGAALIVMLVGLLQHDQGALAQPTQSNSNNLDPLGDILEGTLTIPQIEERFHHLATLIVNRGISSPLLLEISFNDPIRSDAYLALHEVSVLRGYNLREDRDIGLVCQKYALLTLWYATNPGKSFGNCEWENCGWTSSSGNVCGGYELSSVGPDEVELDVEAMLMDDEAPDLDPSTTTTGQTKTNGQLDPPWYGITCDDTRTHVTEINLNANNLVGSIPPELNGMAFPYLELLDLSDNVLTDSFVDLSNVGVPDNEARSMESLSLLTTLDLENNRFTGSLPGLEILEQLENLMLGHNFFSGDIPTEIGALTSLKSLSLKNNLLSGPIPNEIENLTNLESLNLEENRLTGQIPTTAIQPLTQLKVLNLSSNLITGSIPPLLDNYLPSFTLEFFSLASNPLAGSIPPTLFVHASVPMVNYGNLKSVDLSGCGLVGTIPATFGMLTQLYTLKFDHNALTGEMPPEICALRTGVGGGSSNQALVAPIDLDFPKNPVRKLIELTVDCEDVHCDCCTSCHYDTFSQLSSVQLKERESFFVELLVVNGITSDKNLFFTDGTPQQKALLYVIYTLDASLLQQSTSNKLNDRPTALEEMTNPLDPKNVRLPLQKYALAVLYYSTGGTRSWNYPGLHENVTNAPEEGATDGRGWVIDGGNEDGGWLNIKGDLNVCDWFGVECGKIGKIDDLYLKNIVTGISLSGNNLDGIIPQEICRDVLPDLDILALDQNSLHGPIPTQLGSLKALRFLLLDNNALTGTLPESFGPMSLVQLQLGSNKLTGKINENGYSVPVGLVELSLEGNQFSGTIPKLTGFSYLEVLRLGANALSGSIPSELSALTDLAIIALNNNTLTGTIPPVLGYWRPNLTTLDVRFNDLTGVIPSDLCDTAIWSVEVSADCEEVQCGCCINCESTQPIPMEPTMSPVKMDEDYGAPGDDVILDNIQFLKGLILDNEASEENLLVPPSPQFNAIGYMAKTPKSLENEVTDSTARKLLLQQYALLTLYFSTSSPPIFMQSGWTIDDDVCSWTAVSCGLNGIFVAELNLQNSLLNGTIPSEVGKVLTNLKILDLSYNNLTESIPSLRDLTALEILNLSHNKLTGSIPKELFSLSELAVLQANVNYLTGKIPDSFINAPKLKNLGLSENDLTGSIPIPMTLASLSELVSMKLMGNKITGTIPAALGSLTKLEKLEFSNNKMRGEIPNSLGKLIVLAELKLEGEENMFTGKVPDAICDLTDDSGVLEVLTAHCNDFFSCKCCTQCF